MTRTDNRARITVDPAGNWRLYAYRHWPRRGWRMIGTVTRWDGDVGALALAPSGVYRQINGGSVRSLDQRKVVMALAELSRAKTASA